MQEFVVLVDEKDREVGVMEKIEAHRKGLLHRAFSIFVFNSKGELLLQKRARTKYHSAGLWSNTCCSHPRPGESVLEAAHRRLKEEMGFDCELKVVDKLIYSVEFENGLKENEYDYLIIGFWEGEPKPNPDEVEEWKWVSLEEVKEDIRKNPEKYTYWFKKALPIVEKYVRE